LAGESHGRRDEDERERHDAPGSIVAHDRGWWRSRRAAPPSPGTRGSR
jgi:hypothetical protein